MIKVYDRKTKKIYDEAQYKEELLEFLYNNVFGRLLLKLAISPIYSRVNGWLNDTKRSCKKIKPFIDKYDIEIEKYEEREYGSFNDFFIRKLKPVEYSKGGFLSPCDGKLSVYKIDDKLKVHIKNSDYTLKELTGDEDLDKFRDGLCLVYHLTMDCCHRYAFIDDGKVIRSKDIKGKLHTISSISKDYSIYKENHRVVSLLETKDYGELFFIEVGAIQVGKIINHKKSEFKRGEEKGYFKLGGSTIILLVSNKKVIMDEDILDNSKKNIETKVSYLEKVGKKYVR